MELKVCPEPTPAKPRYRVVLGSVYLAALYNDDKLMLTHYAADACSYANANDAAEAARRLSNICKAHAQVEVA